MAPIALGHNEFRPECQCRLEAHQSLAQPAHITQHIAPVIECLGKGGADCQRRIEVAQGFAPTSEGTDPAGDMPLDDDTITERVQRLLQTDAATSNLNLLVTTRNQVVYLRGVVSSNDDGDLAAEVASRIPTVVDVVDETTVAS